VRSASQRLALIACGALLVTAGASGCGRSGTDDEIAGKTAFIEKCGSCHTLARANTKGTQGPNLDEAFGPARSAGLGQATVEGVVLDQISHVRRSSTMPKDLVTGQTAKDVAAYVAAVAGQRGKDEGLLATAGPKVSSKPVAAKGGVLMMPADPSGATRYKSTRALAEKGSLKVESKNVSSVGHDIALKDASGKELGGGEVVQGGGVSEFTASVKPGKYEYLCTVPGHAEGGMKGILTVK
jgi:mono/diheme cytochrome c family protein